MAQQKDIIPDLWDFINDYAASCGGNHIYGNTARQHAVTTIEQWVAEYTSECIKSAVEAERRACEEKEKFAARKEREAIACWLAEGAGFGRRGLIGSAETSDAVWRGEHLKCGQEES